MGTLAILLRVFPCCERGGDIYSHTRTNCAVMGCIYSYDDSPVVIVDWDRRGRNSLPAAMMFWSCFDSSSSE